MACPGAGMRTFPCICRGQPAAVLLHLTTGIFPANAGVIPQLWQGGRYLLHIPRERGGQPFIHSEYRYPRIIFPANAGVNLRWRVRVQVCEHSPCVSRDAPFSQILGISPSDYPLRWQGCSDAHLIQTIYCVLNSPYAGLLLRNRCRFRRITPFLCFRRVGSSVRKKDAQLGRDLPCIGRGLSIGNKYTNSPRIDGVEPKTKTASTEELPCASGGSKVVCICHSNPCICGEKSTKAR